MEGPKEVLVGDVAATGAAFEASKLRFSVSPAIAIAEDDDPLIKPTTSSEEELPASGAFVPQAGTAPSCSEHLSAASMAMAMVCRLSENPELLQDFESLDGEPSDAVREDFDLVGSRICDSLHTSPPDTQQTPSGVDYLNPISVIEGVVSSDRVVSGNRAEVMDEDIISAADLTNASIGQSVVMLTEAITEATTADAELLDPDQFSKAIEETLGFDGMVTPSGNTIREGGFNDPGTVPMNLHESSNNNFQNMVNPLEISSAQDFFMTDSAAETSFVDRELKPMKEAMDEREIAVHGSFHHCKEGLVNKDESQIFGFDVKVMVKTDHMCVSCGDLGVLDLDSKVVIAESCHETNVERQTHNHHDSTVTETTSMGQIVEFDKNSQRAEAGDGHGKVPLKHNDTKPDKNTCLDDSNCMMPGFNKEFEDSEVVSSCETYVMDPSEVIVSNVPRPEAELATDSKDVFQSSFVHEPMVDPQPSESVVQVEEAGPEQDIQADCEVSLEKGDSEIFLESAVPEGGMELGPCRTHQVMEAAVPENVVLKGRVEVKQLRSNGLEAPGPNQDTKADLEASPEDTGLDAAPEGSVLEALPEIVVHEGGMESGQLRIHQVMEATVSENAVSEGTVEIEQSRSNGLEEPGPNQDKKADSEASPKDAELDAAPEVFVLGALPEIAVLGCGVNLDPSWPHLDILADKQASPENAESEALREKEGGLELEHSKPNLYLRVAGEALPKNADMETSAKYANMQASPENADLEVLPANTDLDASLENAVPEGGVELKQSGPNLDMGMDLEESPKDTDMAASPENAISELEPSSSPQDMQASMEASPEKAVHEQQPKKRGRKPGKKVVKKVEKEVENSELESPTKRVVESDQKRELRKRGRKPGPKISQKEEEDVCFVCFDGGNLILCDRRSCPKAYHVECTGREADFFHKKGQWFCGWHVCSQCARSATVNCYMCPSALCSNCVRGSNFLCIKKARGLCQGCYPLVHMIEHNETINGDPVQADFNDKETYEGLFREYWEELKTKCSLSSSDLVKARKAKEDGGALMEGGNDDVDEVVAVEDGNSSDSKDRCLSTRHTRLMKRKRLTRNSVVVGDENVSEFEDDESEDEIEGESTPKRGRTRAPEFDGGWCSKELADLIQSLKEDPKKQLPLFGVKKLLWKYIDENKLTNPRRRGQILCDERLQKIYGRKHVGRFEMMKLIGLHLASPNKSSAPKGAREWQHGGADDNAVELYESDENVMGKRKPKRKLDDNKRTKPDPSEYAAVNLKNIKLIYLKRSVLDELRNDPELESKAVGAFVRIRIPGSVNKNDACYRLVQVVGVKQIYDAEKPEKITDVILEILNLHKREEITADLVSNQELVEEECKRLRQSVRCGFIKAMTVGELEERARDLREAKVKDWFEFELLRLSHLRDRASEKGRKKELRECVEKLQLLSSPEERVRQMKAPFDIDADPCMDPDYESEDEEPPADDSQGEIHASQSSQEKGFQLRFSDKSKSTGGPEKQYNLWSSGGTGDSYKKPQDSFFKPSFWGQKDVSGSKDNVMHTVKPHAQGGPNVPPQISQDKSSLLGPGTASWGDGARAREQSSGWNQGGGHGRKDGGWTGSNGGGGQGGGGVQGGGWIREDLLDQGRSNVSRVSYNQAASAEMPLGPMLSPIRTPPASYTPVAGGGSGSGFAGGGANSGGFTAAATGPAAAPGNPVASTTTTTIDIEKEKVWCYQDPTRTMQGPFTMEQLRKWEKTNLFPPDLRIWRVTETLDASILLSDALAGRFHSHSHSQGSLQNPSPFNNQAVGSTQGAHANGFPVSSVQGLNTNSFPRGSTRGPGPSGGNNFPSGPTPGPMLNAMGPPPQQQRPIVQQSLPSTNPMQGPTNLHGFPSAPMQGPNNSLGFTSAPVQGPHNVHGFASAGLVQQGPTSVQGFPLVPSQGLGAHGFPPAAAQGPYGNNFAAPPPQGPNFNSSLPGPLPGPMQGPSVTGYPPNLPPQANVMPGQTQALHAMPGQGATQFNNAPPGQGSFVNNNPMGSSMPGPVNHHPPPHMGQRMSNPGRDFRHAPMPPPNRPPPANDWPERPGPNQQFMGPGTNMGVEGGAWRGGPAARRDDEHVVPPSRAAWRNHARHDDRDGPNRGHTGWPQQDFRGSKQYQGNEGRFTQRKDLMCKYYTRGLCRKGETCDFRHH